MTAVERLLTRKKDLIARLRANPSLEARKEIDSQLVKIDTALDLLVQPTKKKPALIPERTAGE
jgi:hypothetical protein